MVPSNGIGAQVRLSMCPNPYQHLTIRARGREETQACFIGNTHRCLDSIMKLLVQIELIEGIKLSVEENRKGNVFKK